MAGSARIRSRDPVARTARCLAGDSAEDAATVYLLARGWSIVARNLRIARDEVDIVALEPSSPTVAVLVEVRSGTDGRFGAPEGTVDAAKVGRLYRAAFDLLRDGRLPDGRILPAGGWRVDLVTMVRDRVGDGWRLGTHLRGLDPP